MRIVRRRRAIHRVAARVRGHRHHAHAVRQASIHRLQVLVIEGLGQQHRRDRFHQLRVGDRAVLRLVRCDARLGVLHRLRRPGRESGAQSPAAAAVYSAGLLSFSAASCATPVFSSSPALATKRSLLAW